MCEQLEAPRGREGAHGGRTSYASRLDDREQQRAARRAVSHAQRTHKRVGAHRERERLGTHGGHEHQLRVDQTVENGNARSIST
jgi:hypothetical protein